MFTQQVKYGTDLWKSGTVPIICVQKCLYCFGSIGTYGGTFQGVEPKNLKGSKNPYELSNCQLVYCFRVGTS